LTQNLIAIRFVPVISTPIYSAQDGTKYFNEVLVNSSYKHPTLILLEYRLTVYFTHLILFPSVQMGSSVFRQLQRNAV